MQVNITANTIQQIINADTVNLDQIRKLTPQEQSDIIEGLITTIRYKAKSHQDTDVPGLRGAMHDFSLNAPGA